MDYENHNQEEEMKNLSSLSMIAFVLAGAITLMILVAPAVAAINNETVLKSLVVHNAVQAQTIR